MHENEVKDEVREKKGEMLDSLTITAGSAAKGISVAVKCYYNSLDIDDAQARIENILKIRQFLIGKGVIQ